MNMVATLDASIAADGYAVMENVISPRVVDSLREAIDVVAAGESGGTKARPHALRNLLKLPAVRSLAASDPILDTLRTLFPKTPRAVRAILFDKNASANWKVAWHQDLSIAVKERIDVPEFGPWSEKSKVEHVQPPVSVLERMITVRLHLDDCGPDNGPLRVLPGSHSKGVLTGEEIARLRKSIEVVGCHVPAGGVVLMRPLILHASSEATNPQRRRVIHIEYSADELPGGLQWHDW